MRVPVPGEVLLVGHLMPSVHAALAAQAGLLDGRDPADRGALIAAHRGSIRAIATHAHTPVDRALIAALPRLELISCVSAGLDYIDCAAAAEHGVRVTNTSAALAGDVADLAMTMCVGLLRRLPAADRYVREGRWVEGPFPLARSATGSRLGLLGFGTIGRQIAARATVSGMRIAYTSRTARTDVVWPHMPMLRDLAAWADILVVCCPASPATKGIVDAEVLSQLRPDGYLINVARGSIVDEGALVRALRDGTIAGAGLDVFADEPRPAPALLGMENVVLSPHVGSGTRETRAAMGAMMIDNILRVLGG